MKTMRRVCLTGSANARYHRQLPVPDAMKQFITWFNERMGRSASES
jgi:hypothetical protein